MRGWGRSEAEPPAPWRGSCHEARERHRRIGWGRCGHVGSGGENRLRIDPSHTSARNFAFLAQETACYSLRNMGRRNDFGAPSCQGASRWRFWSRVRAGVDCRPKSVSREPGLTARFAAERSKSLPRRPLPIQPVRHRTRSSGSRHRVGGVPSPRPRSRISSIPRRERTPPIIRSRRVPRASR